MSPRGEDDKTRKRRKTTRRVTQRTAAKKPAKRPASGAAKSAAATKTKSKAKAKTPARSQTKVKPKSPARAKAKTPARSKSRSKAKSPARSKVRAAPKAAPKSRVKATVKRKVQATPKASVKKKTPTRTRAQASPKAAPRRKGGAVAAALSPTALARMQGEMERLKRQNSDLGGRFDAGERELAALRRQLAEKDAEIARLGAEVERLEGELDTEGDETSIAKFVEDAGAGLMEARRRLAGQRGGLALGRVSLDLKMVPSVRGRGLRFPSPDEVSALGGDRMSRLTIDFDAAEGAAGGADESLPQVPRVTGYTEVLARRKLAGAGFVPEVVQAALTAEEAERAGKVVKQWPAAGRELDAGSVVTVAIGKAEE